MCFVFIWEQTATCTTYSINWSVFITEMKSVYCAVRTGSLNKAVWASYLKGYSHLTVYLLRWLNTYHPQPLIFLLRRRRPPGKSLAHEFRLEGPTLVSLLEPNSLCPFRTPKQKQYFPPYLSQWPTASATDLLQMTTRESSPKHSAHLPLTRSNFVIFIRSDNKFPPPPTPWGGPSFGKCG